MNTGRKERVVIGCVTFETAKVTEPVKYYQATRVHIIHYLKEDSPKKGIYRDFFDTVCDTIRGEAPIDIEIVDHNERVSDFSAMLRTVLNIITEEQRIGECDIYINISSGTPEYAAAAAIASMMSPGTIAFSVGTKEYMIDDDTTMKEMYYDEGKPVGLTRSTYDPKVLPSYTIEKPPEYLVRGLRILYERGEERLSTNSTAMVKELREKGLWIRDEPGEKVSRKQSDAVNYHRDYIQKWAGSEWIEKDDVRRKYHLTEKGKNIIDTFYTE